MNLTQTQPIVAETPGTLHLFNAFSIAEKGAPSLLFGGRGLAKTDPLKRHGAGEYVLKMVDVVTAALDIHVFTAGPSKDSLRPKVVSTPAQHAEGRIAFVMLNVTDDVIEIPAGETLYVNVVVCSSTSLIINKPAVALTK